jgi:hypothetical protein
MDTLDSKTQQFLLVMQVFTILSTIASLTVLVAVASSPVLRSKTLSVIAGYVALSDFISSLFCALHFLMIKSNFYCQTEAFFASFFNLSAIFWMCCLTHVLFCVVVRNQRSNLEITRFQHFLCWFFPLFLSLIPRVSLDITWGAWPIEGDLVGDVLDARRVLALGCFFAPTETSSAFIISIGGLLPFVFYVLWVYIGVIFMIVEVIWVLIVASRLYAGYPIYNI